MAAALVSFRQTSRPRGQSCIPLNQIELVNTGQYAVSLCVVKRIKVQKKKLTHFSQERHCSDPPSPHLLLQRWPSARNCSSQQLGMPRILICTIQFDSVPISFNYGVTQPQPRLTNPPPPKPPPPSLSQPNLSPQTRSPACHFHTAALDGCLLAVSEN